MAGYGAAAATHPGFQAQWSVDANAAWTPAVARQFLPTIAQLNSEHVKVFMLEQPFPCDCLALDDALCADWAAVAAEYAAAGCVSVCFLPARLAPTGFHRWCWRWCWCWCH